MSQKMMAALAAASMASTAAAWNFELPPCLDPYKPFVDVGCYDDSGSTPALTLRSTESSDHMTVESCVSFCKGNGYRYAGLEYYGICFCGQTINSSPLEADQCNFPCNGNSSEVCGGNSKISVWADPTFGDFSEVTTADYKASGCWSDDSSEGRALSWKQEALDGSKMTPEMCLGSCKDGGYPYAGLEYGGECYCGVAIGNFSTSIDSSKCSTPCNGDASQTCGGPGALSLYVADELLSLEPCNGGDEETTMTSSAPPATSTTVIESSSASVETSTTSVYYGEESSSSTVPVAETTSTYSAVETTSTSTYPAVETTSTSTYSAVETTSTSTYPAVETTSTSTYSAVETTSTSTYPAVETTSTSTYSAVKTTTTPVVHTTLTSTTVGSSTTKTTSTFVNECTSTVVGPSQCEYGCGKWCANTLPEFTDKASCIISYTSCKLQSVSCFKQAGMPAAAKCFEYSSWCEKINNYCSSTCGRGKCNKANCFKQLPPAGYKPGTTSTSVYPCPATATATTTVVVPTSSSTTVPTSAPICVQPSNKKYGYGPGNACGGIDMPVVSCNNAVNDKKSKPFKMYSDKNWGKCPSYNSGSLSNACADACAVQRDSCLSVYAEGCKQKDQGVDTDSWFYSHKRDESASYFDFVAKRTIKFTDTYDQARTKCYAQYNDCLAVNKNVWSESCK
ncbi:uncharacterized protein BROUX77_005877 [Berkeleyomyces rouxiae]|uniref:uncharacterized protein n=1 Tax=Berkeleyomyces rouxiae TaxID=2035830 RepID=UPI003B782BD7